jgi:hypothetical protein
MGTRIYSATLALSLLNLLLSLIGVLAHSTQAGVFGWLIFCPAFLWILFILNAFLLGTNGNLLKLLTIWAIINLSILSLYIMFALEMHNWASSRGIEVVIGITYFPIAFPVGMIINFIPGTIGTNIDGLTVALTKVFGNGVGAALSIWLVMSVLAGIQSIGLVLMAFMIDKRRQLRR